MPRAIRFYRLGGVCLVPVARDHDPGGRGGVVISWTTHDLLSIDWDRWREYQGAREVMNGGLAQVLDTFGFEVWPFGPRLRLVAGLALFALEDRLEGRQGHQRDCDDQLRLR